jgi:predicted PurR-regulated permease PerM
MQSLGEPHRKGHFLISAAAFVVVVAGMRAAAPLLVPFLLSLFIATIAAFPLFFLKKRGLSTTVALLLVIGVILLVGLLLSALIGTSLDNFNQSLPEYEVKLKAQVAALRQWLHGFGFKLPEGALQSVLDPAKAMSMAGGMLASVSSVLANAFLILLTVVFMLFEASGVPAKLRSAVKNPEQSVARLETITIKIKRYMVIKTWTSLATGVLVTLWLWTVGVDFPVLWGVLAFLLNYVPNIGSIIAAVPAVLLALVQLGPDGALWAGVGYVGINVLIGSVLEPRLTGQGLGLSTLVVFVSLVFWGWVLGPVGMFLSVPLTMILKIALDSSEETRWIAVLLDSEVPGSKSLESGEREEV